MTKRFKLKSMLIATIAGFSVVGLASCSKTSLKSIGYKDVYAQTQDGKYTITNGELWQELKWNSTDVISEKINDVVLQEARDEINEALKTINGDTSSVTVHRQKMYFDYLESMALSGVYGVIDFDSIYDLTDKEKRISVNKYVDTAYVNDMITIDTQTLEPDYLKANAKKLFSNTQYETTYYMWELFDDYLDTAAQKYLAFLNLEEEIIKHDKKKDVDELYYTDEEIIQFHRENYLYSADRQIISIKFTNSEEISTTFKAFGIKTYNNTFYFIPQGGKTEKEYSKYYDEFEISNPSNSEKCFNLSAIGGESAVFELYVEMYNYVYSYREPLPSTVNGQTNTSSNRRSITEQIVAKYIKNDNYSTPEEMLASWNLDSEEYETYINYTQEELVEIEVDFKTYVSKTLKVDPSIIDGESRYTIEGLNYNNGYYMVFKISEDELKDEYKLTEDEDDTVIPDSKNEYKELLIEEMMWNEITDSYTSKVLEEKIADCKLYIYDSDVEILYSSNNSSYSKTHKNAPTKNTLFTIVYKKKKTNVSVGEVFNRLEETSGVTTAIDLLSRKAIKDTKEYADTKKEIKTYNETLELLLSYFANDQLNGYSSSLGKYNFLKLYFHSADVDTIIDNYYRLNAATQEIITNYGNNDTFYKMVQSYAKTAYEYNYKVSVSNLLVYVDMDDDSEPDTNFDWNKTIPGETETYAELAQELVLKIISNLKNSTSSTADALSAIVEEIKGCQRFTNGIDTYEGDTTQEFDPTQPETRWAKYKRAGLNVKIDEYTDVTNKTEEKSTGEDGMVSLSIKTKIKELYDTIKVFDQFPSSYADFASYENGNGWKIETGYGMLVLTSITERGSAKFETKDDINGVFTNLTVKYNDEVKTMENIYNSSDNEASTDQIKFFVLTYLTYGSTELFPSSLQTYVTDYVMPIYEKYNDSSTQRELLLSKLLNGNITFTNASNGEKLDKIRLINQRISDEYLTNDDYAYVFPNWWTEILK